MRALVTVESFYGLIGAIFALVAVRVVRDRTHPRRWATGLFWTVLAVVFLGGRSLPPLVSGYLVLALVMLAATRGVVRADERSTTREERVASAARLGHRLFWPALLVPGFAVLGSLGLGRIAGVGWVLVEPRQLALIALGTGAILALVLAMRLTRAPGRAPVVEASRLLQSIGWALILPQLLAALGGIFGAAQVGEVIATGVARLLPVQVPFVAVLAYAGGMALFTVCLGNAFAAWPVMTLGVGLPLIVQQHHGNVAIMAGIGMLSGYCGTLLTPMAANFNIVPAMLLELDDRNAVIRAQVPIALTVLAANILLMYFLVFRF